MINVLIADDHPVVRHGIREIISAAGDMRVADEATDGRELLARARTVAHDLVILDISMPATDGLEVLKELKRERPRVPVLILTMHSEDQFAIRALKGGAAGYLMKETAPAELVNAIRKAVAGGRHLTLRVAERLADHLAGDADAPLHEALSDREYQVMRMMATGKPTRQIASDLALSVKTVSTYRARIFEKMHMQSPAELAGYVVRNRLSE